MMINVSFAELFMPVAATSDSAAKDEAAIQAEQEFAAFLAASLAPVSAPAAPEPLPIHGTETPVAKVDATAAESGNVQISFAAPIIAGGANFEAITAEAGKLTEWVAPVTASSNRGIRQATESLDVPPTFSTFSSLPNTMEFTPEFGAETVKQAAGVVKTIAAGQEIVREKDTRDNIEIPFLPAATAQAVSTSFLSMQPAQATETSGTKFEDTPIKDATRFVGALLKAPAKYENAPIKNSPHLTDWKALSPVPAKYENAPIKSSPASEDVPIKDTILSIDLTSKNTNHFIEAPIKEAVTLTVLPLNESANKAAGSQNETESSDKTTSTNEVTPILHRSVPVSTNTFPIERTTPTLVRSAEEIPNGESPATDEKPNRYASALQAIDLQNPESADKPLLKPVTEAKLSAESDRQRQLPPHLSAPEMQCEPADIELPKLSALALQHEPSPVEQPEKNTLSVQDSGSSITPTSLPADGSGNPPLPSAVTNTEDTHSILSQTSQPLIELAQNTQPRETRTLHLSLHPAELGRVEVEITRDDVGHVSASLTAEHGEAANTLTQSIGQLREALEQAGLTIERLEVATTPQFQHSAQGQAGGRQQSHSQHSTEADYLPLTQPSTDGSVADEEEKLLSLRA